MPNQPTAPLFSCSTLSPFGRATLVFDSKTKGAQMLTKKVSTFEKSEHLSILTQKRKALT